MKGILHTDGGARGNPGPSGIGYVLRVAKKNPIEQGEYIGRATNNQAEYRALIEGLKRADRERVTELICYLDSELVVKQLNGQYRVRDAGIKLLYRQVLVEAEKIGQVKFKHVPRERNKKADRLVNRVLDNQG